MTATMHRTEKWPTVTRQAPCAICEKPDWCVVSPDGAIAGCMREQGKGYFKTAQTGGGDMYLHRPEDTPYERPVPRPKPGTTARDIMADRAVFAIVARACAELPPIARDELARRFGSVYGPRAVERFGIGYLDGPILAAALAAADRTQDAQQAGILWENGTVTRSIAGKLSIPHIRDGLIHDLRIAGIKGIHEETKEISLPGSYAEREIGDLFFNHDALNDLGEDGVLHVCGGAYKAMGLILAGLENTVGLRGEAELSAGHIAALHAAGVRTIILHIDNEEPKPGEDRSAGRRLGLVKAERLAAAGFAVLIAEPPREPGTAKVDPDALLRDLGPRAVRDYALSAIPLDAWRVVIGEVAPDVPDQAASIARIEAELAEERRRRQIEQAEGARLVAHIAELETERDLLHQTRQHADQTVAANVWDAAIALKKRYERGAVVTVDGEDRAPVISKYDAQTGSAATLGRCITRLEESGIKVHRYEKTIKTEAGNDKTVKIPHLFIPPEHRTSVPAIVRFLLPPSPAKKKQGGSKPRIAVPVSGEHPDAPLIRRLETIETFRSMPEPEKVLGGPKLIAASETYFTKDGDPITKHEAHRIQVEIGYEPPPWWNPAPQSDQSPADRLQVDDLLKNVDGFQVEIGPVSSAMPRADFDAWLDEEPVPIPLHGERCAMPGCVLPPGPEGMCGRHESFVAMTGAD